MSTDTQLDPLPRAMTRPGFYPHQPGVVELRQTHISYVFLADAYVYKIRKPVRFTFLDYSTLEQRRHFSLEEVRLNRRLAPSIYLGVVPITLSNGEFVLCEDQRRGTGSIVEYAVKMRRLPEDKMLDRLIAENRIGRDEIRAVAERMASFHESASTQHASRYGSPESVGERIQNNFKDTAAFVGSALSQKDFDFFREYSRNFLETRTDLFVDRIKTGRVREGHGDLRAEHICIPDEGPILAFDCIEFSESLRYCDVASEIGFLAMDLDFLGVAPLAHQLTRTYGEKTQDETMEILLPFYKSYRAYVRGKVESLKSVEPEIPEEEKETARLRAQKYFDLAYRYAQGERRPAMLVVCGLAGTGKSTMARRLGVRTGFDVLSSDVMRKKLAGIGKNERREHTYGGGIYSPEFTERTYQSLRASAEQFLQQGKGAIIDATFKKAEHRRLFTSMANNCGVPILFIECTASEGAIQHRLEIRRQRPDEVSDATWEVYQRQRREFEPFESGGKPPRLVIDTERPIESALPQVEDFLTNRRSFKNSQSAP